MTPKTQWCVLYFIFWAERGISERVWLWWVPALYKLSDTANKGCYTPQPLTHPYHFFQQKCLFNLTLYILSQSSSSSSSSQDSGERSIGVWYTQIPNPNALTVPFPFLLLFKLTNLPLPKPTGQCAHMANLEHKWWSECITSVSKLKPYVAGTTGLGLFSSN